jgi:hypothetical protein
MVRLPSTSQRAFVVGRTGSGKTIAALWHLSQHSIESMPWVIYDFKTDEHIADIPGANFIGLNEIPKQPGVYIARPLPDDGESVEKQMWRIWEKERIGVYIDEAYMVGNDNSAFRALLTQGRSKRIPMLVCSQRPVWVSRFVLSESDFFQIFHLNDERDRRTLEALVPANLDKRLPDYHSWYYDVGKNGLVELSPVPNADIIMETFENRLSSKRRKI